MRLSRVSKGSVAALVVVMLVGAGVLWALADRPAVATDTQAETEVEPRIDAASQTVYYGDQAFTIPMLDESYGTVDIHGVEYPLNQAGQSYGSAEIAYRAYETESRKPDSTLEWEDLVLFYPDLITVTAEDEDGNEITGYAYKEDYIDATLFTPLDQQSWPVHQDGVDDYKYYVAYEPDGITRVGEFKRIAVQIPESCVLSDGTIAIVGENYSIDMRDGLRDYSDDELAELASLMGIETDELKAKIDAVKAK